MTFSLNINAQAEQISNARANPLSPGDISPGFFEGGVGASLSGLVRGMVAKPALFLGEAVTPALRPIARDVDKLFGTDTVGFLEDERRKNVEFLKAMTPTPETTGLGAQILHSLFDIAPTAILTGGTVTGVLEGVAAKKLAEDKGVDETTALLHGVVQGVGIGVGVKLPLSIGARTAPDLLWAAASSVLPNAAARAGSHKVLADAGYAEMAAQYQALDATAIAADAVLGVFFGGAGRVMRGLEAKRAASLAAKVQPSDLDAALSAKATHHLELDTAPGIPRDPASRDAHVQAALKATDDLLAGRPVDVGNRVEEADFQRNPRRAALAKEQNAAVREHLGEAYDRVLSEPLGPANDPLVRLTVADIGEVIVERGPVWKKGEADISVGGHGIVKFIWKHGEKSAKSPEAQITREDVLRAPEVMRDYVPIEERVREDGHRTIEWQVERQDGKRVIYAVAKFADGNKEQRVVSIFVNEQKNAKFKGKALSETKNRPSTESPGGASKARPGDTDPGSFSSRPGGQEGGSDATVARAGEGDKAGPLEVELARQVVKASPDLMVVDETGAQVKASELLARADEEAASAEKMGKGFIAAVTCFLKGVK